MAGIKSDSSAVPVAAPVAFGDKATQIWFGVFPAAAASVLLAQPGLALSTFIAFGLMIALLLLAILGAAGSDGRRFDTSQMVMGLLAPLQFALMIWASVAIGHYVVPDSILVSTLVAFSTFGVLVFADAMLSIFSLLAVDRTQQKTGLSAANLIVGKYAGLLGKFA